MKLKRIHIERYKNLVDFECEFSDSNISAFIGNNGSGKSNLLEAISDVFSFAKNSTTDRNPKLVVAPEIYGCEIEYECDEVIYTLMYTKAEVTIFQNKRKLTKKEMIDALPKAIFLYYAGETQRQLRTAKNTFDESYNYKLKNTDNDSFPGYKFIDYYSTEDLCLLLFTSIIYKGDYYKKLLKLLDCEEISPKVSLVLKSPNEKKEGGDTYWGARGFVKSFLDEIRKYVAGTQDLSEIYVMRFEDIELLKNVSADENEMFAKLKALKNAGYLHLMAVRCKNNAGEEFDSDCLSEGEKQLSLLILLTAFTARDDCLYLFDEFDAYLHLNWQKSFAKMIGKLDVRGHMIFTTHSPATISGIKKKNVYIMSEGKIAPTPSETFNRSLDEIMEEHMLVSMRPHEYSQLVQEFRNAIMHNQKEIANVKLEQLQEIIGAEDPFFITARIALNRMESE